jgi:hypothetical protein
MHRRNAHTSRPWRPEHRGALPVVVDDQTLPEPGRYFTDGTGLYRRLGSVGSGRNTMIELEDCRSLEIVLLTLGEFRARTLRGVIPEGEEH